jgi:hypothetical protein
MLSRHVTVFLFSTLSTLYLCDDAGAARPAPVDATGKVDITDAGGKLKVEIGGKLFTEYCYKDVPRPYLYPVIGPTGDRVNRNWPMEQGEGDATDHVHHRSLWFTHGDVNGHDFWSETEGRPFGKIVHDEFVEVQSGPKVGVIVSRNKWVAPDGETICTDTRTHRFQRRGSATLLDFEVTIHATQGKVTFGDTKEGSMAIRLAPTMRLKGEVGQGHIVNSEGVRDKETWGKRAAWVDYYGPVGGKTVGVSIFDHPDNPRHPTWWHVRDYGLFAANPFGVSFFEKKEKGAGELVIPAGESLTFKYRFYIHEGDEKQGAVDEVYREYAAGK